jgi:hypothetical protein
VPRWRTRLVAGKRGLFILLMALVLPAIAASADAVPTEPGSRYQRLIAALQEAPEEQRREFAGEALGTLAEILIAEADLARRGAGEGGEGQEQRHWARAVDDYAASVLDLLDAVDAGASVEISGGGQSPAILSVDGQRIILTHPRVDQQAAFEQSVLQVFCATGACAYLLPMTGPEAPVSYGSSSLALLWVFNNEGLLCAYDGVSLQFPPRIMVPAVRELCDEFHRELSSLLVELRRQARQGVVIDWSSLSITRRSDSAEHLLHLNARGDAVLQRLPLLASRQNILALVSPWLAQRVAGNANAELVIEATDLGWSPPP